MKNTGNSLTIENETNNQEWDLGAESSDFDVPEGWLLADPDVDQTNPEMKADLFSSMASIIIHIPAVSFFASKSAGTISKNALTLFWRCTASVPAGY